MQLIIPRREEKKKKENAIESSAETIKEKRWKWNPFQTFPSKKAKRKF